MVATAVDIRECSVADIREHADALLQQHWQEVALNKGLMHLKPDWSRYEALEGAGCIVALAAWEGEAMVGYSVSFLTTHIHYADLFYAQNDVLFVAPEHRRTRTGIALIHATELACADRGARMLMWHAKSGTALEAILPRLGYRTQDIIFSREL